MLAKFRRRAACFANAGLEAIDSRRSGTAGCCRQNELRLLIQAAGNATAQWLSSSTAFFLDTQLYCPPFVPLLLHVRNYILSTCIRLKTLFELFE
jgi:hypothetical protein